MKRVKRSFFAKETRRRLTRGSSPRVTVVDGRAPIQIDRELLSRAQSYRLIAKTSRTLCKHMADMSAGAFAVMTSPAFTPRKGLSFLGGAEGI